MKKILSLLTASILFLGIGFAQVANAEWQKSSNGWNYYDNGSLKTGWIQDNGNWYFLNKSGNMVTGWIEDKGTWYYAKEDGSLNNSKTTTTTPREI
jgi:glucan-binding YG repeat protein